jgi:hypothetical protein
VAHPRQLIRDAVTALLTGETVAETRVFKTRMVPYRRAQLPALAVYSLNEPVERGNAAPKELERRLELAIEGALIGTDNVDDALDDLALEIETAMHADDTLTDTAEDSILSSTELEVVEDGDRTVGLVRLVYSVTYFTHAPETGALDSFTTGNVKTSLSNEVATADQPEDTITVEGG